MAEEVVAVVVAAEAAIEKIGEGFRAFRDTLSDLRRNGFKPLVSRLLRRIAEAKEHLEQQHIAGQGKTKQGLNSDIAVVAGLSLTMLGVKALKILPALPFAPGHKFVLLTPLYLLSVVLTRSRFGATWTGTTMGGVAFLMGDGKYGVFELLKHIAPGLLADLIVPFLIQGGRLPGRFVWTLVGGVLALGRFATIFLVVLAVQAPSYAYAILLPGLTVHLSFGLIAGFISYYLLRAHRSLLEEEVHVPHNSPASKEEELERKRSKCSQK